MVKEDEATLQIPSKNGTVNLAQIEERLSGENFRQWRREQQYRENIKNNNPEYNSGGYPTDSESHLPHQLGQCHRKTWYRENNAAEETQTPDGIFAIGEWAEEEIVGPWLNNLAEKYGGYYSNDLWLEGEYETSTETLQFRGKTDSAICDSAGMPLLLTEIKTKQSLSNLETPQDHHKMQLATYQYCAAQKHDISPPIGYLLYLGKKRFDLQAYRIEFDSEFFAENVADWAEKMTQYRQNQQLPPANPEQNWECKLCEYQARCGKADEESWSDCRAEGFLPLFEYPQESVLDYLASHENPELTPTIAHQYPRLAADHPVANWECECCDAQYAWDSIDWDGDVKEPPTCPQCASRHRYAELSGPAPEKQSHPTTD